MKTTKNIARLAITAGLTAALSFGGVMVPVTMAFADDAAATTNSITINKIDGNENVKYKAYQIFKADVVDGKDGSGKVVSNVEWAVNTTTQSAIIEAINTYASNNASNPLKDNPSAQDVAVWLKDNFGSYGDTTIVGNSDLFNTLAKKVQQNVNPAKPIEFTEASFPANQPVSFSGSGYYLFLTDSNSISKSDNTTKKPDTGTSPIFAVIGDSPVTVTEKTSIPTVNKAIYDDEDKNWTLSGSDILTSPNRGADSSIGRYVKYQLVGTVASNINTYDSYEYTFKDKLPETMTPKYKVSEGNSALDVTVKIDGRSVGDDCSVDYRDHVLTIHFGDLKNCKDANGQTIGVSADSRVTVEYEAMLDPDIICNENDGTIKHEYENILGMPQENTVKLEYSNNPNGDGIGSTVEHPAYDYTYGIDVTKVGSDKPNDGLANVEFLLREDGSNKYIKANGTTTDNAEEAVLKTDANGKINVFGLDQGTYILTEKTAAPGYNNSHSGEGIKFTISRNTLPANKTEAVQPVCNIVSAANLKLVRKEESTTGMVHLTVTDEKGSNLPLTGLNGVTFTWIAGGAVLCIGVAHLIRSRKRDDGSEE